MHALNLLPHLHNTTEVSRGLIITNTTWLLSSHSLIATTKKFSIDSIKIPTYISSHNIRLYNKFYEIMWLSCRNL